MVMTLELHRFVHELDIIAQKIDLSLCSLLIQKSVA